MTRFCAEHPSATCACVPLRRTLPRLKAGCHVRVSKSNKAAKNQPAECPSKLDTQCSDSACLTGTWLPRQRKLPTQTAV